MNPEDSRELAARNRHATQVAGAAVAHFMNDDRRSLEDCLTGPAGSCDITMGLVRFAGLAVAQLSEHTQASPVEVARSLTLLVADLDDE